MLPLPGAPGSSWPMYRERIRNALQGIDATMMLAFWLFGVINNVLYVIILSAALDLVGPTIPKGVVLLADVLPSFLVKLVGPYVIDGMPYSVRVMCFATISTTGMLLIARDAAVTTAATADGDDTDPGPLAMKMAGIILASASSGLGESSFLGLTHYYGRFSLAAFGSGTGASGLIGAGTYALLTTVFRWSVRTTLFTAAALPAVMLLSFFVILPRGPLKQAEVARPSPDQLHPLLPSPPPYPYHPRGHGTDSDGADDGAGEGAGEGEGDAEGRSGVETDGLIRAARRSEAIALPPNATWVDSLSANLRRSRRLFVPFMLPLLFVYVAEYTINQGVSPTLLFPLEETPFARFRAFYPAYTATYQAGVFLSRSSVSFFRIHNLYTPSLLQVANLLFLIAQSVLNFIPNVYLVMAVIFWEGILGGLVYVNTFAEILDTVPLEDREFSLAATSVSDSGGICIASFLGMALEVGLCRYQVHHGRDYCKQL